MDETIETTYNKEVSNVIENQHPDVDGAVKGLITDLERVDDYMVVTIEIPMYDDVIKDKVAKVNGIVCEDSILSEYIDDFDDIYSIKVNNPIPIHKKRKWHV